MKAVVAIDSFKGSLSSLQAGNAVREGILRADPDADVQVLPLADGGEGTVEALTFGLGGTLRTANVTGPLGGRVRASYGVLPDGVTAVMEMSAAAGITLLKAEERDPLSATTFGVGEMIRDAIAAGCRRFLIGIGGSATNDGGAGMLQALGFGFLNARGGQVPFGARGLGELRRISFDGVLPELKDCSFRIACDVGNPLCGERGASVVFAPQKGAAPASIPQMDRWMRDYAVLARSVCPGADPDCPGSGAAGGLGFAFRSFLGAVLESGVGIVLEETGLSEAVQSADLVVTGEGRLDAQTVMGKAPIGVARIAKEYGRPVIAFSGSVSCDAAVCNDHGIDAFFPILRAPATLREAMEPVIAQKNLADTAEQVFRLFMIKETKSTNYTLTEANRHEKNENHLHHRPGQ